MTWRHDGDVASNDHQQRRQLRTCNRHTTCSTECSLDKHIRNRKVARVLRRRIARTLQVASPSNKRIAMSFAWSPAPSFNNNHKSTHARLQETIRNLRAARVPCRKCSETSDRQPSKLQKARIGVRTAAPLSIISQQKLKEPFEASGSRGYPGEEYSEP